MVRLSWPSGSVGPCRWNVPELRGAESGETLVLLSDASASRAVRTEVDCGVVMPLRSPTSRQDSGKCNLQLLASTPGAVVYTSDKDSVELCERLGIVNFGSLEISPIGYGDSTASL